MLGITRGNWKATLSIIATLLAVSAVARGETTEFDLILRHGTVIDGSGAPRRITDVGIVGGRIASVGDLASRRAKTEIDATGLFVAPGFINIHSHATAEGLVRAENMLTQGVTTEIVNADGGGPLSLTEQLDAFGRSGLAVNVGGYIGFNSIWEAVMGETDRRPRSEDIVKMRGLLTAGLEAGAWGVSAGLDYKPAYYATTAEVIDVVEAARGWSTNFANHERLTPETQLSSVAGISETLEIGAATGTLPVVTHIKAQGHENGRAFDIVARMDKARIPAVGDVYPYLAGMTALRAFFIPGWAQEGGRPEMLKRFGDPKLRKRIAAEGEKLIDGRIAGGMSGIRLIEKGKRLSDVAREQGVGAGEAVIRVLEESDATMIADFGIEKDLEAFLRAPQIAVSCDCGASTETRTHPRSFGSFPRVLGRYVRERGVLTWEEAIRKMTSLPARIIGATDRGRLEKDLAADITVFDPKTIIDHATYEQPTLMSEGIRYVIVNGQVAMDSGKTAGIQAGRALRRTRTSGAARE
jgi:N-acyl-D-aspartate/D-glutamate deacylase